MCNFNNNVNNNINNNVKNNVKNCIKNNICNNINNNIDNKILIIDRIVKCMYFDSIRHTHVTNVGRQYNI